MIKQSIHACPEQALGAVAYNGGAHGSAGGNPDPHLFELVASDH